MKFVLWLRKHKEVTFPQKNIFFAFSLVYVTNTVVLEKLNLYIMRHYSLFLKGNTVVVFFLEDEGEMQGIKFIYSSCV